MTVVDFKTDAEIGGGREYRRQWPLYALAIERSTGDPHGRAAAGMMTPHRFPSPILGRVAVGRVRVSPVTGACDRPPPLRTRGS